MQPKQKPIHSSIFERLKPKRLKRFPSFIGIGTQKGGTTTLHKLLIQHPKIFLPKCKEIQYFSLHAEKSTNWYSQHFYEAGPKDVLGEITPYYLFHPSVPKRISSLIPKVHLIALLRDPVDRAISQYFHAKRHGFETLELADALFAEKDRMSNGNKFSHQKHSYVSRSRYVEQLSRYEELFPENQILIIKSEDLFQNTSIILSKIYKFIGVDEQPINNLILKENSGLNEVNTIDPKIKLMLKDELKETVEVVKERYGIDWGW